jgi:all-trans-retinol dehydrogenase (NAD+)
VTDIAGKNILITGGTSGIGRLVALKMAQLGGTVAVWDIDSAGLDDLVAELKLLGKQAYAYLCDVSDHHSVYDTAARVQHEVGPIDILINSAGVVSGTSFLELSESQIERTMGVNTLALFWTAKAFLPAMVAADAGHIVTIASAAGTIGVAGLADYCASKWAAVGFDESLRVELRRRAPGVKTTVVCPYFVDTGMFHGVKTRFPFLLPILTPEYVADGIVRAVRRNKPRLVMPRLVHLVPFLRIFPTKVLDTAGGWLGINVAMDSFQGRSKAPPSD